MIPLSENNISSVIGDRYDIYKYTYIYTWGIFIIIRVSLQF